MKPFIEDKNKKIKFHILFYFINHSEKCTNRPHRCYPLNSILIYKYKQSNLSKVEGLKVIPNYIYTIYIYNYIVHSYYISKVN